MLIEQGSQKLREFTEASYQEKHTKVTDGVWHISGLGHSNAVVIEGKTGVILIDTLDSLERMHGVATQDQPFTVCGVLLTFLLGLVRLLSG